MASRRLVIAVLMYVALDMLNPFLPGIFSFDYEHLFVDAAVRVKCEPPGAAMMTAGPVVPAPVLARDEPAQRPDFHGAVWLALTRPALRSHARQRATHAAARAPSAEDG